MLKFIEDKQINKYITNSASWLSFLFQHFMKIYFYRDHNKGLFSPDWTLDHWLEEICGIIDPRFNNINFDKIHIKLNDRLRSTFNARKLSWDEVTKIFTTGIENYKDRRHTLPKLDKEKVNSCKNEIYKLFEVFIKRLITRLNYTGGNIDPSRVQMIIYALIDNKSESFDDLVNLANRFSFSMEDEYIDRYMYLQNFIFKEE